MPNLSPDSGDQVRLLADFELLETAVREAGALALGYFGRSGIAVKQKADGSRVSEADLAVDKLLQSRLMETHQDYGWLSEETTDDRRRLTRRTLWIVDPIDGTNAFLSNIPEWTVVAALVTDGAPVLAAVYNPVTDEMFTARRGAGAWLNGMRIAAEDRPEIAGARMIATGGFFKKKSWAEPWPEMQVNWVHSIAYRMAQIAYGRVHATVSHTPKSEWDLAAPTLLVQEAGGIVTEFDGRAIVFNREVPRHNGLVAAGRQLHPLLVERTRTFADTAHNR